jgi:hypothetical protein
LYLQPPFVSTVTLFCPSSWTRVTGIFALLSYSIVSELVVNHSLEAWDNWFSASVLQKISLLDSPDLNTKWAGILRV